ncbi:MAG: HEAT repeat domain-containing protein [Deltaproteobacteria bacterium]|nr:HEAT repeat domain-containing protein [Deltaproteobacteria bacterium]
MIKKTHSSSAAAALLLLLGILFAACQGDPFAGVKADNPVQWGEAVKKMVAAGDPRVIPYLEEGLKNGNRYVRKTAAWGLGRMKDTAAVESLTAALDDEFWEVRKAAVVALGDIGDDRGIVPLITVLGDADCDVRYSAMRALEKTGAATEDALLAALRSNNGTIREGAAKTLQERGWRPGTVEEEVWFSLALKQWEPVKAGGDAGLPVLVDYLAYDDISSQVMVPLFRAVGPAAVRSLELSLGDDDSTVRARSAEILDALGWKPSTVEMRISYAVARGRWDDLRNMKGDILTPLLKVLRDGDAGIRRQAAEVLSDLHWKPQNDRERIDHLIAKGDWEAVSAEGKGAAGRLVDLLNDRDPSVRSAAALSLGSIGDGDALPALMEALADRDCTVRQAAVEALGLLADPRAVPALIGAMKDRSCDVREKSAPAFARIGEHAVEPLIAVLEENNRYLNEGVLDSLGQIGDPRAVEPVIGTLGDTDKKIRISAARALGEIRDRQAVVPLVEALHDVEQDVRESAAKALGEIGDAAALDPLTELLRDTDNNRFVRENAVEALGNIHGPETIPILVEALGDRNGFVRAKAAGVMGGITDARVEEALIAALADEVYAVQAAAAESLASLGWQPSSETEKAHYLLGMKKWEELAKIGSPAAVPLLAAMKDPDSEVKTEASGALVSIGGDAVEILMNEIADGRSPIRADVAEILGDISDSRSVEVLITALNDDDSGVRKNAAVALGRIGDARAVQPLIGHLRDWWAGEEAAAALEKLNWKPQHEADRIHWLVAKRNFDELKSRWNMTKAVLFADLESGDFNAAENALTALLKMDMTDDIIPELIDRIQRAGNGAMAEAFLNSPEPKLVAAARQWAARHGYSVKK